MTSALRSRVSVVAYTRDNIISQGQMLYNGWSSQRVQAVCTLNNEVTHLVLHEKLEPFIDHSIICLGDGVVYERQATALVNTPRSSSGTIAVFVILKDEENTRKYRYIGHYNVSTYTRLSLPFQWVMDTFLRRHLFRLELKSVDPHW